MPSEPTIETILHQIDKLRDRQTTIHGAVKQILMHQEDFRRLRREIEAANPIEPIQPPPKTPGRLFTSFFGIDIVVSQFLPVGEALMQHNDGTFTKVRLRGPTPPPIPPYCDIVRLVRRDDKWDALDATGKLLARFEDQTVQETPWLNALPR